VEGALAKWSDNSKLWVMKGVLLEDLNMKDKAKQAYLKAIELGLPPEVEREIYTPIQNKKVN
jgi:Flp pilus assembly protein TadD